VKARSSRLRIPPALRTKLLMAFLVIEVLLVAVGVIGFLSTREADQQTNQVTCHASTT